MPKILAQLDRVQNVLACGEAKGIHNGTHSIVRFEITLDLVISVLALACPALLNKESQWEQTGLRRLLLSWSNMHTWASHCQAVWLIVVDIRHIKPAITPGSFRSWPIGIPTREHSATQHTMVLFVILWSSKESWSDFNSLQVYLNSNQTWESTCNSLSTQFTIPNMPEQLNLTFWISWASDHPWI